MDNRKYAREMEEALAKQQQEDTRRLREFPGFANYSDNDLKRLVEASHRTSTSGPWPLIQEQTPSDACYILLSGEVAVYVGHDRVAVLGPGEVIGESALRQGKLRNATVTTTGKADVLRITRNDLSRLLDQVPALRKTMDETVAKLTDAGCTVLSTEPSPFGPVWTTVTDARGVTLELVEDPELAGPSQMRHMRVTTKDLATFRVAFGNVSKNCQACHQTFRIQKN